MTNASASPQVDVDRLLRAAIQAKANGRAGEAADLFQRVLRHNPDHPGALNSLGMIALARSDAAAAEDLFLRAATADPNAPDLHVNVAKARRMRGDDAGERASLEAALALDQRHFVSLLRLAELHERRGEHVQAIERWTGVVTLIDMADPRGPELDVIAARGRAYLAQRQASLATALEAGLAAARAASPAPATRRFDAAMDVILGRRRVYANECHGLHFPFLPADEWFDRAHFPWLPELEAHTAVIRRELEALLEENGPGLEPYVALPPGTPANKWSALDKSLAWSSYHLWRHGERVDEACARCPETARVLAALPQAQLPGRTPTAFFSLLKPRTRIPPHTGVSNVRAVIHLPLIVPDGCAFRVGGETRPWREGEAIAFDDTIEHEAWNDSDRLRAVLIFDVWNPHLTRAEQEMLGTFYAIADTEGRRTEALDY